MNKKKTYEEHVIDIIEELALDCAEFGKDQEVILYYEKNNKIFIDYLFPEDALNDNKGFGIAKTLFDALKTLIKQVLEQYACIGDENIETLADYLIACADETGEVMRRAMKEETFSLPKR